MVVVFSYNTDHISMEICLISFNSVGLTCGCHRP